MELSNREWQVLQVIARNLLDRSIHDALMGTYIKGGIITKDEYELLKKIAK